jgi:hypothetical protein
LKNRKGKKRLKWRGMRNVSKLKSTNSNEKCKGNARNKLKRWKSGSKP